MNERKSLALAEFKVIDDEQGIVETLVAVSGIEDQVKDIIKPGALGRAIERRTPLGVWSHDWDQPVSKPLDLKELSPGDEALPESKADGTPWPAEAGALYIKAQFNLETEQGRDAYSWAKFLGVDQQWSIGYQVPPGGSKVDKKTGIRHIEQIDVFEYSQVLHGAMPATRTLTVKSLAERYSETELTAEHAAEIKAIAGDLLADGENVDELAEVIDSQVVADVDVDVDEPKGFSISSNGTVEFPVTSNGGVIYTDVDTEAKLVERLAHELATQGFDADVKRVVEQAMKMKSGAQLFEVTSVEEFVGEAKSVYTYVAGSQEESSHMVRAGLRESSLFGMGSHAHVVATFEDRVVAEVMDGMGESKFFEIGYTQGTDGITFGDPVEVVLSAQISEKANLNDVMAEVKAGRMLSQRNTDTITEAVASLMSILDAAGLVAEAEAVEAAAADAEKGDDIDDIETKADEVEALESKDVVELTPEEISAILDFHGETVDSDDLT